MLLLLLTQLANLLLLCHSKKQFDIAKTIFRMQVKVLLFLVENVTLRKKKKKFL